MKNTVFDPKKNSYHAFESFEQIFAGAENVSFFFLFTAYRFHILFCSKSFENNNLNCSIKILLIIQ